jgi:NAD-dependent deacetylase
MGEDSPLLALLRRSHKVLVFTGAGISTGSGIPDFRGPQGIWKKRQPVYYDEFLASEEKRVEYWEYKHEGYQGFRDAAPNATHRALVDLEGLGRLHVLVTQNIDGLHHKAGSDPDKIIEVHGTNRWTECVSCGHRDEPAPAMAYFAEHRATPTCGECGGYLKLATISFGQALNPDVIERAVREAAECDLVLSLGSTLSVHPAASIPLIPVRNGAPYVVVNRGDTDHDSIATLRIDDDVAAVVPPAVAALRNELEA